jgi:hypothetical protein
MHKTNTASSEYRPSESTDYEPSESTEIIASKTEQEISAEVDIEDSLYGKDRPRRIKIRRKIVYD